MWACSVIIWQPTLKERTRILTKLINMAEYLRKINNFNALMALLAGINNAATYRLKHTREGLSKQCQDSLKALLDLTSTDQSYTNYRKALHTLDPPCIPFFGSIFN